MTETALRHAPLRQTGSALVRPPDRRLSPAQLLALVDEVVATESRWTHLVAHDADDRSTLRLIANELYEVWLLGWTPGQRVELHDHGPSHAALRVVEGTLTELEPGGRGLRRRTLATGSRRTVASGTVHDVLNASCTAATSIHAYSPPLSSMTFYDATATRPLRSERVEPAAPVLHAVPRWWPETVRSLARR
ncbi:MAG: cysteine dioxygenase family protein [Actinomycetota bacterium]|nr:cysteine dioxygenase family protein [Actinomycetota bacterium]